MFWTKRGRLSLLVTLLLGGTLCLAGRGPVEGQEKPPLPTAETEPSVWMRKKLDYSRNILGGLATEDFDRVVENAQAMQTMNKFEGFIRGKMPGYRSQLQVFQSANEEIIKQAQRDNIEGAALAFTQLTLSCVSCHKQLREGRPR